MHERVGVQQLHGAGGEEGFGARAARGFGGRQAEDGAQALASGENRVAHGFGEKGGTRRCGGQAGKERVFCHPLAPGKVVIQIKRHV